MSKVHSRRKDFGCVRRTIEQLKAHISANIVVDENCCWIWQLGKQTRGYGCLKHGTENRAHRVSYIVFRGPIPNGLELDHLCRVHSCVNPEHLEAVTHQENVQRGHRGRLSHEWKTACKRGHPFDETNTYVKSNGERGCKACRREAVNRWRRRNLEKCRQQCLDYYYANRERLLQYRKELYQNREERIIKHA